MQNLIKTEQEMLNYAQQFAKKLTAQAVIELIGDVGAGKTTFTRGLAEGLGIKEPITSPSFTISRRYVFDFHGSIKNLVHYDFYRLPDPGLMSEDLAESIADLDTITVVEWADSVSSLLPENRIIFKLTINPDDTRTIELMDYHN